MDGSVERRLQAPRNDLQALEDRLRELEDREKIRELRATYCFLVDDGRFDELVDRCFTADARCDFQIRGQEAPPAISTGREEVRTFFRGTVARLLRDMSHTIHNHRISLDGDTASGDCYFELTARDAGTGAPVVGAGRYIDRYRRSGSRWLFAERKADIVHMVPLADGW